MDMNKLPTALFLLAAVFVAPVFNQPPGFNPFGKGIIIPPPKAASGGSAAAAAAAAAAKIKIPFQFPIKSKLRLPQFCDLKVPKSFEDRSIVKTVPYSEPSAPGVVSASPTRGANSANVQRAINAANTRGGPDAGVVKAFLDASKKIAASKARASLGRGSSRTKRQAPLEAYISPTEGINMCSSRARQIVTVRIGNQKCDVIPPQEVLTWRCKSKFCSNAPVGNLFLERHYCAAGNKVFTSFYVYCRKSRDIQIHSLEIAINCCCFRHFCNFIPYAAASPQLW